MTELIETAPHEFTAQYNFADGLDPYFAFDSTVKDGDGSAAAEFRHHGEDWTVKLYYQESNIVHPGGTTPAGTRFDIEEIREFRLSVRAADDATGQRDFNAHVRPRWDGMAVEDDYGDRDELHVPFVEGVNVRITGSNIEFARYLPLLQQAARSLNIKWSYFTDPHDSSTVTQAERYLRLKNSLSGAVHARDGPLARMGHLLESDRHGTRRMEQTDMDESGEQSPGYRHQTGIDENRVQEVWPNHGLPKQVKHYKSREHESISADSPLSHPKVGAIYYPTLWRDSDGSHGVTPAELEQLSRELDETVLSVVHDAGISVTDTAPYVEDAYFGADLADRDRQIVELPLQDIEQRQESVVTKHIADGLSPVEWESLEVLVTDGGEVSPADIAESGGFHPDSVYRALDRMDELVHREYGAVELQSTYVAQLVHDAVTTAREKTREAVEAAGKALDAAERGLDERTSAFVAWASKHCESWREADDGVTIDFGTVTADSGDDALKEIKRRLREGRRLWEDMNKDEIKWRLGQWQAKLEYQKDIRTIDETVTVAAGGELYEID
jgi:hypothetical protein